MALIILSNMVIDWSAVFDDVCSISAGIRRQRRRQRRRRRRDDESSGSTTSSGIHQQQQPAETCDGVGVAEANEHDDINGPETATSRRMGDQRVNVSTQFDGEQQKNAGNNGDIDDDDDYSDDQLQ